VYTSEMFNYSIYIETNCVKKIPRRMI